MIHYSSTYVVFFLQDEIYQNIDPVMNGYKKLDNENENHNEDETNGALSTPLWLKAVGNVMTAKQDCTGWLIFPIDH